MQEIFKYFAFISFQSSDAKEALWVQKAIENYRLPTAVARSNKELPKRMRPCFCYLNDINLSEELMMELRHRMEQSEYLIVICSPRSAKSTFVNGGIDYFISLGRRDRIIPLIVEGVPYSNDPETECFPEALRRHFPKDSDPMKDHQILGVNLNEEGAGSKRWKRQRTVLMVIARMLGLEFENLWNRELQRRRKKRITIITLCCAVLLSLCLTWYYAKSIDIQINLQDQTPTETILPEPTDTQLILSLKNEEKEQKSFLISDELIFRNIPRRFIGHEVRVKFFANDFLPIDTVVSLRKTIVLPIKRNEAIYGKIHFRPRTLNSSSNLTKYHFTVAGHEVQLNSEGFVELSLPLCEQRAAYPICVNGKLQTDSLFMPCSESTIFIIDN